ncbi:MAG: hypothetical protein ACERKN_16080 [Velocimicrobium sp.]
MKQNKTLISDDELGKIAGGYSSINLDRSKPLPSWYGTSKCPGPEAYDANKCNGCGARSGRGCVFDVRDLKTKV